MANNSKDNSDPPAAAELIRQRVEQAYKSEPNSQAELAEAEAEPHRSQHQQFMYELGTSGKDLATIQTEWHKYYQKLSAKEKHEVWQEFYASQSQVIGRARVDSQSPHKQTARKQPSQTPKARSKSVAGKLKQRVSAGGKLETKHHLQSILFGLGMGALVLFVFLFGFFNEVLIAPFIQPSRAASATPVIVTSGGIPTTTNPEVIIPKINVEIPVNYTETSTDENVIENDLQDGVVHYPTTVLPGQNGNTAFFGHSSNNIFNHGKYKFAFVLLHTLVPGDTFYLSYNGKMYVYQVISRTIVEPTNVNVLNAVAGQTATATLITCDPPGTSLHRLVVVGKQISPDPSGNTTPATPAATTPANLPGNGPTMWSRLTKSAIGKLIVLVGFVAVVLLGVRWLNRQLNEW